MPHRHIRWGTRLNTLKEFGHIHDSLPGNLGRRHAMLRHVLRHLDRQRLRPLIAARDRVVAGHLDKRWRQCGRELVDAGPHVVRQYGQVKVGNVNARASKSCAHKTANAPPDE